MKRQRRTNCPTPVTLAWTCSSTINSGANICPRDLGRCGAQKLRGQKRRRSEKSVEGRKDFSFPFPPPLLRTQPSMRSCRAGEWRRVESNAAHKRDHSTPCSSPSRRRKVMTSEKKGLIRLNQQARASRQETEREAPAATTTTQRERKRFHRLSFTPGRART